MNRAPGGQRRLSLFHLVDSCAWSIVGRRVGAQKIFVECFVLFKDEDNDNPATFCLC